MSRRPAILIVVLLVVVALSLGAKRRRSKRMWLTVTAYCPCEICCDGHADGLTATGRNAWKPGVAVDPEYISLGSRLDIPLYGKRRGWWTLADDVGGMVKGDQIDVRFTSHREARKWGKKRLKVRVWF